MTSPGIPMLFMGQEFLEDKYWSDNYEAHPNQFIYWEGLQTQKKMADFLKFTSDLTKLRWQFPALRAPGFAIIRTNDQDRVIAYQRWVPGIGENLVIVASLKNYNLFKYRIGFLLDGRWSEVFNSDYYENLPNPDVRGNGGWIFAEPIPWDNLSYSAEITLPANGLLVFSKK